MQFSFEIPEDLAAALQTRWSDLSRAALESLALEAYRSEALTDLQVRRLLGFNSREEADGFLKDHEVYLAYTLEDLEQDLRNSARAHSSLLRLGWSRSYHESRKRQEKAGVGEGQRP